MERNGHEAAKYLDIDMNITLSASFLTNKKVLLLQWIHYGNLNKLKIEIFMMNINEIFEINLMSSYSNYKV